MRALIQRVSEAQVRVGSEVIGQTGPGLLILVCAMRGDERAAIKTLALKIAKLRIFRDAQGRMNRSLRDFGGSALIVPQFTLAGDARRGTRPDFSAAAPSDEARKLFDRFVEDFAQLDISVETGRFGADMQVFSVNDGPVTIWIEE